MKKYISLFLIAVFVVSFSACSLFEEESYKEADYDGTLTVHFIDVGQADCQLLELPNKEVMLIDAGNNDDGDLICDYLDSMNIDRIDYLVGTHPHEDHIGSLDTVIDNYYIGTLYMPDATTDTKTYRDVITAIDENNVDLILASAGDVIYADSDLKIRVVAPVYYYEDLNNSSIVIHVTYKNSTFLFTGDAEKDSEEDITLNIASDVLSVGHHGSSTSTSDSFLERVDPMYAVISCGKNNDYGHPHREILEKLENDDITIFRTDRDGTIICKTSGGGPADYNWETK